MSLGPGSYKKRSKAKECQKNEMVKKKGRGSKETHVFFFHLHRFLNVCSGDLLHQQVPIDLSHFHYTHPVAPRIPFLSPQSALQLLLQTFHELKDRLKRVELKVVEVWNLLLQLPLVTGV